MSIQFCFPRPAGRALEAPAHHSRRGRRPAGKADGLPVQPSRRALGRMERSPSEIPISAEPPPNCQWRWLDPSTLACQLGEKDALRPATRYRMVVSPGIRAEDQATLAGEVLHTFTTERPKVTDVWFKTWNSPQIPQYSVRFNLSAVPASLEAHLYFQAQGGERIPAAVEEEPEYVGSPELKTGRTWRITPRTP
ncbi:hypothetical protein, partial [Desulforhabdus sp. TSK]|uniref:hypothetical protein n=1 Tax=Desulforhabdus sp. TSK TaxID=2925014 RepID=UPI001FC8A32F